jgi:hypothetical protein
VTWTLRGPTRVGQVEATYTEAVAISVEPAGERR